MGASAVRKEARARKFGKDEALTKRSPATNRALGPGDCADNNAEEDSYTDGLDKEQTESDPTSGKPQRFIVFIGMLHLCPAFARGL